MITLTGIITPVRVNELIPRECFFMLYAQRVNLFGMMAVLCSYLRLISRCVICFVLILKDFLSLILFSLCISSYFEFFFVCSRPSFLPTNLTKFSLFLIFGSFPQQISSIIILHMIYNRTLFF